MKSSHYRADIDGLRAIAVLAVLFYHAQFSVASGGYAGVDVFFVISGYLITNIIWHQIVNTKFSILHFYERRIRRIFPALYFLFIFVLIGAIWLYTPEKLIGVAKSMLATIGFSSNILFWSESGYFDTPSTLKPLLHTWSLAVEEQFYLIYPWFLWAGWRYARKYFRHIFGLFLLLSFAGNLFVLQNDPGAAFYFFHLRAWELMIGGAIALGYIPAITQKKHKEIASYIGAILLIYSILHLKEESLFPGWNALWPVLGTGLIIHSNSTTSKTAVGRFLSNARLVFIGKISYSLYLCHWPMLLYARTYMLRPLTTTETLLVLFASGLAATFSWKLVENPFRQTDFLTRRQIFQLGGILMLVFSISSGWVLRQAQKHQAAFPAEFTSYRCLYDKENSIANAPLTACNLGLKTGPVHFAVLGDSHSDALAPAIRIAAQDAQINGVLLPESGCMPLENIERPNLECGEHFERALQYMAVYPEIKTVFLVSFWPGYKQKTLTDSSGEIPPEASFPNLLESGLRRTVQRLLKAGYTPVLVHPIPSVKYPAQEAWYVATRTGRDPNRLIGQTYAEYLNEAGLIRDIITKVAHENNLQVLDPAEILCVDGLCQVANQSPLYYDTNHLSIYGAQRLAPLFEKYFLQSYP